MNIAIFEIGDYHEGPDITRVFSSVEKAIENISSGFMERKDTPLPHYYEDETNEKWLNIQEYKVED